MRTSTPRLLTALGAAVLIMTITAGTGHIITASSDTTSVSTEAGRRHP
ncbi:MAG: hypothetical protein ABWX92_03630 [Mycetocola sp.]